VLTVQIGKAGQDVPPAGSDLPGWKLKARCARKQGRQRTVAKADSAPQQPAPVKPLQVIVPAHQPGAAVGRRDEAGQRVLVSASATKVRRGGPESSGRLREDEPTLFALDSHTTVGGDVDVRPLRKA